VGAARAESLRAQNSSAARPDRASALRRLFAAPANVDAIRTLPLSRTPVKVRRGGYQIVIAARSARR
jgi:hypothetical protein